MLPLDVSPLILFCTGYSESLPESLVELLGAAENEGVDWFSNLVNRIGNQYDIDDKGYKFAFEDFSYRLKFNNLSNPVEGFNMSMRIPVSKLLPESTVDEWNIDISSENLATGPYRLSMTYETKNSILSYEKKSTKTFVAELIVAKGFEARFLDGSDVVLEIILKYNNERIDYFYRSQDTEIEYLYKYTEDFDSEMHHSQFTINKAPYIYDVIIGKKRESLDVIIQMPNIFFNAELFYLLSLSGII